MLLSLIHLALSSMLPIRFTIKLYILCEDLNNSPHLYTPAQNDKPQDTYNIFDSFCAVYLCMFKLSQETEGRFRFSASIGGNYVFCFSNAMSTVTPKVLKFKMIVVQPREADSSDMSEEDKKIKG